MKIERERQNEKERWCFELDGWVDRLLVCLLVLTVPGKEGTAADLLQHLSPLLLGS